MYFNYSLISLSKIVNQPHKKEEEEKKQEKKINKAVQL
jgi:hypothetical protein